MAINIDNLDEFIKQIRKTREIIRDRDQYKYALEEQVEINKHYHDEELSKFIMKFAFFGKLKLKKKKLGNDKSYAEKIINYHLNFLKEIENIISQCGEKLHITEYEPLHFALVYQMRLLKKYDNSLAIVNSNEMGLQIKLIDESKLVDIWINTKKSFSSQKLSLQADMQRHIYIQKILNKNMYLLKMLENLYRLEISEIRKELLKNVMEGSDIIATTIHASISSLLDMVDIDTVIMDEASQISLIDSIIPLVRTDKFILVGDDKQLEPIDEKDLTPSLKQSVFTRLKSYIEIKGYVDSFTFLNIQYRMNKEIADISSKIFYNNQLKTSDIIANEKLIIDIDDTVLSMENSVIFLDFKRSGAYHVTINLTHYNEYEIQVIHDIVLKILPSIRNCNIGIITLYRLQRDKIKEIFKDFSNFIEVGTVDAFQGREKDIIIFSFVRAYGNVSKFMDNPYLLNVSITRAKKKLIILGNSDVLKTGVYTNKIFRKIEQDHLIIPYNVFNKI